MQKDDLFILNKIAQAIFDKKGMNILALDVRNVSSLTDYVIIAEGNVDRHVISMANEVEKVLKEISLKPSHEEGWNVGDWVVLDYNYIMVHLFIPGVREKYHLEELWKDAEIVDLSIDTSVTRSAGYAFSERSVCF